MSAILTISIVFAAIAKIAAVILSPNYQKKHRTCPHIWMRKKVPKKRLTSCHEFKAACAEESLAIGTLNGEQDT